jgi:glycosyltransferase involved in cell wall biosynthesis
MPKVSVIIPCYNQAQYLKECIGSLADQTHACWEALIINDGSTDNTLEIANDLSQKDNRVFLVNKENGGLSSARNAGLDSASGDFYQFLDADDLLFPEKLEYCLKLVQNTQAQIVATSYTKSELVSFDAPFNTVLPLSISQSLDLYGLAGDWETRSSIPNHCFLFAKEIFQGVRFDEKLPNHEDWDCWMRLMHKHPKISLSSRVLAFYRINPQSMCTNYFSMRDGFIAAIDKHLLIPEPLPGLHALLRAKRAETVLSYANLCNNSQSTQNLMSKKIEKIKSFLRACKTVVRKALSSMPV